VRTLSLWTVGHSNRAADELIAVLVGHRIEHVVDVRRYPWSKRHPQFVRAEMVAWLTAAGLGYTWLGESLGGHRDVPPAAKSPLAGYHDHMQRAAFAAGVAELEAIAARARTAFLCAEASPEHCHRALLAHALTGRGHDITHILAIDRTEPHQRRLF